jgi:hypothetical protein
MAASLSARFSGGGILASPVQAPQCARVSPPALFR